ncbi:subclass B3 metallo-beta-lactamase [Chitinophaga horti]|uniref:Subclass B3 metallo-beta-lactamase n=1 Tax=Chitinophaga horti TaxID=2920382 RepID=A0ABY6J744_9BACT|nr:subclass B3 metallo-beta-lactamase [Chitinophaga horti]UYQ95490.1 subclass B3 metallo-beta-lactamase [Chitinophaga horti]
MTTKTIVLLTWLAMLPLITSAQQVKEPKAQSADWSQPYKPFRIAGNVYYVGTRDLASYLITSSEGHILINTGLANSAPIITANIKTLGFKLTDVKILTTNQVHFDHVGALAALKKATGAKVMVDAKDAAVLADGGKSDYYFGGKQAAFAPVKADRLLNNNDKIQLGNVTLTLLHHPGHTKGSCSFMLNVKDESKMYKVLIANMPTIIIDSSFEAVHSYPGMAADYAYTLAAMPKLDFDIWVAAHASQFDLHKKRKEQDAYNPTLFTDKAEFKSRLSKIEADYRKRLAK